mgnify:CR=1
MKIIAIDPGFDRCGVCILEKNEQTGKETLVYSECVQTGRELPFSDRLHILGTEVSRIITQHSPTVLALEELFFKNNQKTAMKVAEARGMILYLGKAHGLSVAEYTPLQIKTAITGYGRADKAQVSMMVYKLIEIPTGKKLDDELDAIACGLTHFAYYKTLGAGR